MYLYSPVFGFWMMATCAKGSYKGYFSIILNPLGMSFGGAGGISTFFFLFFMLNWILTLFSFASPSLSLSLVIRFFS